MWSIYVETESCVSSSVCAACNRVDTPRRSGSCSLSRHSRCSRSSHSCPSGDCRRSEVAFPDTVPAPSAVCRQPWKLRRRREVGEEAGMKLSLDLSLVVVAHPPISCLTCSRVWFSSRSAAFMARDMTSSSQSIRQLIMIPIEIPLQKIYMYIYILYNLLGYFIRYEICSVIFSYIYLFWFLFSYFFCQSRTNCLHRMFSIECAVGGIWQIFHSFLWGLLFLSGLRT